MPQRVDRYDDRGSRESLLMRGVLDMCVLALLGRQPMHAYGLVQMLQGHGFDNTSYGSIYPLVARLRKQGLVEQQLEPSASGPARNVLAINETGRVALDAWSQQWRHTTDLVSTVLADHDTPAAKTPAAQTPPAQILATLGSADHVR